MEIICHHPNYVSCWVTRIQGISHTTYIISKIKERKDVLEYLQKIVDKQVEVDRIAGELLNYCFYLKCIVLLAPTTRENSYTKFCCRNVYIGYNVKYIYVYNLRKGYLSTESMCAKKKGNTK